MNQTEDNRCYVDGTILDVYVHNNYAYMEVQINNKIETVTSFTLTDQESCDIFKAFLDHDLSGKEAEFVATEYGYRFVRFI